MHLFISHATKDSGREALALAESLELQGHVCWIAPRDVRPGIPYPRQIVEALEQCSGLVLLLSPAANDSADVLQEVQLAAQAKRTIAPVVLNGTVPGADLRYYVSVRHQIAWSGAEATARRLVQTFPSTLRRGEERSDVSEPELPTAPPKQTQLPVTAGATPDVAAPPLSQTLPYLGGRGKLVVLSAGALVFAAVMVAVVWQPWREVTNAQIGAGRSEREVELSESDNPDPGEATVWEVDASRSTLRFVARLDGDEIAGQFSGWRADIRFDPGALNKSAIDVVVQTVSLTAQSYEGEMESADWFDTGRYPVAQFSATEIVSLGDNRFEARGQLTIKGRSVALALPFTFNVENGRAIANGKVTLNRNDFGLGLTTDPRGSVISPRVEVHIHVEARQRGL
jgi:polyisoprenoid-binding protein YceI